ncbi:virulence-associated E family protein [Microcoleus sp. N9_B4]|uniref:virulence-associated E family protein n=1 Tax=Microcoleus sp. N9_B4 TaxID=3055386 RepID=UPI002FD01D3A
MYTNDTSTNGQNSTTSNSFDIRDHLEKLEPGKGKDSYTCPVCGGNRLTVDTKKGAYQCWSGGCSTKDIREAIRPLNDFLAERNGQQPSQVAKKPKARKKKEYPPAPIPIGAKLLMLPAPGQSPQPEQLAKDAPKRVPSNATQTTYEYSSNQKAVRYEWPDADNPKGHNKTYSQFHIDTDGKKVRTKGEARWPAYRIDEVVEALAATPDGVPVAILMPEGEPNVDLARSYSIAGLTMQGSNWSHPEIQIMLEALQATGKNVVLAKLRDNDDTGIKKGQEVWLVARHIQFPCVVIDPRKIYPDIPEKGDIREILEAIGPDEFLTRMNAEIAAQTQNLEPLATKSPDQDLLLEKGSNETLDTPTENNALRSDDKLIQDYNKISAFFGNRIRLNKLSKRIEINGQPVSIDRAKIQLATKYGILARSGREDLQDILMELAHQNAYSPIEEYLLSLPQPKNTAILDNLAERYFGATLPIYQSFVRKTLISAVARALSPGCKVDTALILQGDQGFLKSTFFKILAGGIYFDDSVGVVSDKDERLKLHRAWVVEWSELESIFSRRDVSSTKAFLSSSVDALRPPYHRDTQDFPRASIIVGSTNKDEFLSDETGNRRFWVVPVEKKIDVELLTQERDAIWSAALLAYKSGEKWWLTSEEDAFLAQANQNHQITDVWEAAILKHLQDGAAYTISDLLEKAIGLELAKQSKREEMRVTAILRRNGWTRVRKRNNGKRDWYWEKVSPEVSPASNALTVSVLEENHKRGESGVGPASNALTVSVLEKVDSLDSPLLLNLPKNFEHTAYSQDAMSEKLETFVKFGVNGESSESGYSEISETLTGQRLDVDSPPDSPPDSPLFEQEVSPPSEYAIFEIGDRVWIKNAGSLYNGAKGTVVDPWYGSAGMTYLVKLDELVNNILEVEFEVSDLMPMKN